MLTMYSLESFGVSFQKLSLNGIDFFSFEKKGAPIFASVFFHAGSKYNEKDGTAHFLEHLLIAGSEKFPSKNLLADFIESVGGRISLSTNSDFVRIDFELAEPTDTPRVVAMLDQMIHHPLLSIDLFEMEKKAILAELAGKKAHQREFIWEVYRGLFFQDTPLSKSNLGTEEVIRALSLEDVAAFKQKYFDNGNVSVVMSGGFDTHEFADSLSKVLGSRKKPSADHNRAPILRTTWYDVATYPSKLASIVFGFRTDTQNLKDEACAKLCAEYLAGGRSSELITTLRYEKGLVYSVSVLNQFLQNASAFAVRTECDAENTEQTLSIINQSFRNLCEFALAPEILDTIKSKIVKSFLIELQTSKSWVLNNERFVVANDGKSIIDFLSAVNAISVDDIKMYAQKNFLLEKKYIAACGPERVSEIIKKIGSNL